MYTPRTLFSPENSTLEPNMRWIGGPVAEISPFDIFQVARSVGPQYAYTDVIYRYSSSLHSQRSMHGVKTSLFCIFYYLC